MHPVNLVLALIVIRLYILTHGDAQGEAGTESKKMEKFTTEQLKQALIGLRAKNDADSEAAFELAFDEVAERMGDDAFDAWCDSLGW